MNRQKQNRYTLWLLVLLALIVVAEPLKPVSFAQAETSGFTLVKDVNDYSESSYLWEMYPYKGNLYFFAEDTIHGRELWRSDGNDAYLFKDINPGPGNGGAANGSDPCGFGILDGNLFFGSDDGVNGAELWVSDGTPENTLLFKDLNPNGSSWPMAFENSNNLLFFLTGASTDQRLWRTNGTPEGTFQVTDFPVNGIVAFNNEIYFSANDETHGWELWKTSGLPGQAELVKDINPAGDALPQNFYVFGTTLYFSADDGTTPDLGHGRELWKTDSGGTYLVKDINPGVNGSDPTTFTSFKNKIYFAATTAVSGYELWSTTGTTESTLMVADIYPGSESGVYGFGSLYERQMATTTNYLFFMGDDGAHGKELWKTDGINTSLAADVIPGAWSSWPFEITSIGDIVYFAADGKQDTNIQNQDTELYHSDGITTQKVKDIYPGNNGAFWRSGIYYFTPFNGKLLFVAEDGHHGEELWISNGTENGTRMVRDINEKSGGSGPRLLTPFRGKLFFAGADPEHGCEPWITDGTHAGTYLIKDVNPSGTGICGYDEPMGRYPTPTEVNGWLYFISTGADGYPYYLLKTDGTEVNTQQVSSTPYFPYNFMIANGNKLFFIDTMSSPSLESLTISDGTASGTKAIYSFTAGVPVPGPVVLNGWVYFFLDGIENKFTEMWKSNGSQTIRIKTLDNPSFNSYLYPTIRNMVTANGLIFFLSHSSAGKFILWQSDGTGAGTQPVEDGELAYEYVSAVEAINDTVYFTGILPTSVYPNYFCNLYRTQGKNSGVSLVRSSINCPITAQKGKIYFSEPNGNGGEPLWQTDGTDEGTKPFLSTMGNYKVYWPLVWNSGNLIFMASDIEHGVEMWISPEVPPDGPSDLVRMVSDFSPGTASTYIPYFTNLKGQVVFPFDDGLHGKELWAYEVAIWKNLYLPVIKR